MYTFLENADLKDNAVIVPFCTSASSPAGTSAQNLSQAAPSAVWKDSRRFAIGTDKDTVSQWIDSLQL